MPIDAWMQHPTPRFLEQPFFESLRRWVGADQLVEIPIDFTLAGLEAADMEIGFCAAWHGPMGALISNDEVAGWVKESNGRLAGVATADLYRPMEAVRELRRCVKQLGFKALRVVPWLWNLPPNDRRYYPLYAECCELGVPFCTQIGHTGPLCPSEPGRPIPYLEEVLLEFPELVVVGGHIGSPWLDEVLSLTHKFPNFYIDTSAYKPSRYPAALVDYMRGRGRKKVLFGTNFPMLPHAACLAEVPALNLDPEAADLFLHGNARRIFKL